MPYKRGEEILVLHLARHQKAAGQFRRPNKGSLRICDQADLLRCREAVYQQYSMRQLVGRIPAGGITLFSGNLFAVIVEFQSDLALHCQGSAVHRLKDRFRQTLVRRAHLMPHDHFVRLCRRQFGEVACDDPIKPDRLPGCDDTQIGPGLISPPLEIFEKRPQQLLCAVFYLLRFQMVLQTVHHQFKQRAGNCLLRVGNQVFDGSGKPISLQAAPGIDLLPHPFDSLCDVFCLLQPHSRQPCCQVFCHRIDASVETFSQWFRNPHALRGDPDLRVLPDILRQLCIRFPPGALCVLVFQIHRFIRSPGAAGSA